MYSVICFEILPLPENAIIHEINHAITRDEVILIMEENQTISSVHKIGLIVDVDTSYQNNNEIIIEELINDKTSQDITKIFKQKGGDLTSFCLNIPFIYPYQENFYLIDEFYDTFKEYIKISRISDNKNALVERIGKTNYDNYENMVNSLYTKDTSKIDKLKEENHLKIKNMIAEMKKVDNNSHDISKQDLDDYLEDLKNQGFKIKMINDIPDEVDDLLNTNEENIIRR